MMRGFFQIMSKIFQQSKTENKQISLILKLKIIKVYKAKTISNYHNKINIYRI